MADLTIIATNVGLKASTLYPTPQTRAVTLGETVTEGQPLYRDANDGKYYLAESDTTVVAASTTGVSLEAGNVDDTILMITGGSMDLGATLTVGELYVVSNNTGKIAPIGDLSTGNFTSVIGYAYDASTFIVNFLRSGVAKA